MIHNHEVPGSIPGPATKSKGLKIRHLRGFHSWVSFLFIKAFAQILHEFTKLRFYEKGHKKELGSGYKTATKLLADTKILLSFHFLSSLVKNKLYADYFKYPTLVFKIPMLGTWNTKEWYLKYQRMVLRIPTFGTQYTKGWHSNGTCRVLFYSLL